MKAPQHKPARYVLRRARAAETRAAILRAAADGFASAGLAGARTEAIARTAGVNKSLLHYYFKSKDGLYSAVLEEHLKEFSLRAQEIFNTPSRAGDMVLRFVSLHFDFVSARPYYPVLFLRLLLSGAPPFRRLMRKYMLPVGAGLIRVISEGTRSGEFRRVDPVQTAISIIGVTVHYFTSAPVVRELGSVEPFDAVQLRRRKAHVLEFVQYGLFRDPKKEKV